MKGWRDTAVMPCRLIVETGNLRVVSGCVIQDLSLGLQ